MDIDISNAWKVVRVTLLDKQSVEGYVYTIDPDFGHLILLRVCMHSSLTNDNVINFFVDDQQEKRARKHPTNSLHAPRNIFNYCHR